MIFKSNFVIFVIFLMSVGPLTVYSYRVGCQFNTYFGASIACEDKEGNLVDCFRNPYQIDTLYGQCKSPHYHGKEGINAHVIKCADNGTWTDWVENICVPVCVEFSKPLEIIDPSTLTFPTPYIEIQRANGSPTAFPGIIINEETILTKYKWIQEIQTDTNIKVRLFNRGNSIIHESPVSAQDYSEDRSKNLKYDKLGTLTLENILKFDEFIKPVCPSIVYESSLPEYSESVGLKKYIYWRPLKYSSMCKNPHVNENKIEKFCNRKACKHGLDYDEVHTFCKIGFINDKLDFGRSLLAECHQNLKYGAVWTVWGEESDCQLVCGKYLGYWSKKTQSFFKQTIFNGQKIEISSVPWHVGIFANNTMISNEFIQVCGGSIVHTNIVISAAHCFYNYPYNKLYPTFDFLIGAGKTFRTFEAEEEFQFYSNVEEIYIPQNFKPSPLANDIAVVILKTYLKYNSHIQPICLTFKDVENYQYPSKTEGFIVGWGSTSYEDESSTSLMTENFYTLSTSECKKMVYVNSRSEITGDKICIKSETHAAACRGDSGGGFFTNDYFFDGKEKHLLPTLSGVISLGINSHPDKYCSNETVTVLTNIQFYENFIKAAITKSQTKILFYVDKLK